MTSRQVGVSGMRMYVPKPRVQLEKLCEWTGADWSKVRNVVGASFRMRSPWESVYTMAATAVLDLIDAYDVDPSTIGSLSLGTESSSDNAAGAVVVRGMVDAALRERGLSPISRNCEVPEYKHACLGGVYALKGALRYLQTDGRGRCAIVVSGDIAEYARGSSGEPTQGAGVVAMLLEENPSMFAVDPVNFGTASAYRGPDFRKPVARFDDPSYATQTKRHHDFPVFSGKYSTVCYIDETLRASEDFLRRIGKPAIDIYRDIDGIFFHRPYRKMPLDAFAALVVWGMASSEEHHRELEGLCQECGVEFETLLQETRSRPELFSELVLQGRHADDAYPNASKVAKALRRTPRFSKLRESKLSLGSDTAMHFGNLYTASLPAWIAAGFAEAAEKDLDLAGASFLNFGYGSGDAAEVFRLQVCKGWKEAAARMQLSLALQDGIDLERAQYERLHDEGVLDGEQYMPRGFYIKEVGRQNNPDFQDLGVEYYAHR